jgi:hypothetical protein
MKRVFLDPDGTIPEIFGVIVAHPTDVLFGHQCAGTETLERWQEGYYVPIGHAPLGGERPRVEPLDLTAVFHQGSACYWGGAPRAPTGEPLLPPDRLATLRKLVAEIRFWTTDVAGEDHPGCLCLDETRLNELVEAWVPVLTPDGTGILVWDNCD